MKRLSRYVTLVVCLLALAGCAGNSFELRVPFEKTANGYTIDSRKPLDVTVAALPDIVVYEGRCVER